MSIDIGIIGNGFVGKAMHAAFLHNSIVIIDPKYTDNTVHNLAENTDVVFICLPAPTLDDGSVDSTLISNVFNELKGIEFSGLVVLKSTLPPDVVDGLTAYNLRYIYSPEFLREQHWEYDALHPEMIMMAGSVDDCSELIGYYKVESQILGKLNFRFLDYKDAALMKYAINTYLASKVVFMNQLNQLYRDMHDVPMSPAAWETFANCMSSDPRIGESHMLVPGLDNKFGYGGTCFPKDVKALLGFDKNKRLSVLTEVELANTKLRLL